VNSPLNYTGGKSRLARHIIAKIPKHTCYCEVFSGAAWVFFKKEPSEIEVLNDRDEDLVNLFRIIQNHYEEFVRQFRFHIVSRKIFEIMKRQDPFTLTDIQRAVKYFYIMKSSFAGKLVNPSFGYGTLRQPGLNLLDLEEKILSMHWRLANVYIENIDFRDCLKRYDREHTFFYLDPPYYGTKDYSHNLEHDDFVSMEAILESLKGKFILSLGDRPEVRKIFERFKISSVMTAYSRGRKQESRSVKRPELLIQNY